MAECAPFHVSGIISQEMRTGYHHFYTQTHVGSLTKHNEVQKSSLQGEDSQNFSLRKSDSITSSWHSCHCKCCASRLCWWMCGTGNEINPLTTPSICVTFHQPNAALDCTFFTVLFQCRQETISQVPARCNSRVDLCRPTECIVDGYDAAPWPTLVFEGLQRAWFP